jgi:hypothetical protein
MSKRIADDVCQTISCQADATHVLSWPGWDGQTVTEKVCEPCGEEYARRPSLKAKLTKLDGGE